MDFGGAEGPVIHLPWRAAPLTGATECGLSAGARASTSMEADCPLCLACYDRGPLTRLPLSVFYHLIQRADALRDRREGA